jgi:hypothetical protein
MDGSRSSPLAAAVGLVVVTAGTVRRLPHVLGEARRVAHLRYDELALHGRDVLTGRASATAAPDGLRDGSADGFPDGFPGGFPDEAPGPVVVTPEESAAADAPPAAALPSPAAADAAAGTAAPQHAAPPSAAAAGTAAPFGRSEPVQLPEDVQDEVAQLVSGADLDHADLPLADFDHQTVPQLRGRLRTLTLAELVQLRDYEQAHAARLPVLTLLDNRIAKLLENTDQ